MNKRMKKKVSVGLLLSFLIFAFGFFTNSVNTYAASADGAQIVQKAREYIGKVPYVWGGNVIDGTNPGADCSGFICCIYDKFGYYLWSNRTALRNCGTNLGTDLSYAQLGDIIWFEGHVGIYSGVNSKGQHMVVHETGGSYKNVVETPISWVNAELKGIIRIPGVTVGKSTTHFVIENGVLTAYTGTDSVVVIPDGVTSIGNSAFWNCQSLTSIEIPNSVTSIEDLAFMWCSNLTSVEIPNSVTYIGLGAFEYTKWLENKRNENPFVIINSILIDAKTTTGDVEIPNSVTYIGAGAFESCSSLTSVEIPNSVTSISDRAFICCSNLTSIEIPNSVTSIGERAFYDCSSLTSVEIPNSVTYIGKGAFLYCSSLTSVKIPDSVTYIGESAFCACRSLTSVEIPNSVTSIGRSTFFGCSSLTSVEIPNSVTSIGYDAFSDCNNLTIYGDTDSYAQTYANENNIPFVELEKEETDIQEHEHDFSEYTIEKRATLNEWGMVAFICSGCDETEEYEIPEVNAAVLAKYKYTYNGKNNKPSVTVTDVEGNTLINGTDYSVKYSGDGKSVGRYTVTVTLKGLYSGTKTLYYYVMPKAPTGVEAVFDKSGNVTMSWKKSTGATGYCVYYKESTDDTYIWLGSTKELIYTEENFQQGVKYDFKIVPYYIANEKVYFSDNVAVKSVTFSKKN